MLHNGPSEVEGVPVEVVRKRIRRINIRVAPDGTVCLSVPKWWATLRQGEVFLREKWKWVKMTRAEVLARPAATCTPVTEAELEALRTLLGELNAAWVARVCEEGILWKIRRVSYSGAAATGATATSPTTPNSPVRPATWSNTSLPMNTHISPSTTTGRGSTPSWTSGFRAGRPSGGGAPAAPVAQQGAMGRKMTFVQTEFWK